MSIVSTKQNQTISRRTFLKTSTLGAAGLFAGCATGKSLMSMFGKSKPNFLFIVTDQQNLDAISAHGNPYVKTPNLDRLVKNGVSFLKSYSTNPVCSPARSSMLTGRMPSETGVVSNDRPLHDNIPTIGEVLRKDGYETAYAGKWHVPETWPTKIRGFDIIPVGAGQGDVVDSFISRQCEAFLINHDKSKPFMLTAAFLQPHDICFWAIHDQKLVPKKMRFNEIKDKLPELPPNHSIIPRKPKLCSSGYGKFNDEQWRYYLYTYYRQIEMVDADIGRVINALEDSGQADNTIIIFSSDHGEGAGRHSNVSKWYPFDEAANVPFIVCCPEKIRKNIIDSETLVSGLDIVPTICDFAGVDPPKDCCGKSLKPILETGKKIDRKFVAYETHICGRNIRSDKFKYVKYKGDPVEMLFDMENDPWETKNLYDDPKYNKVIKNHRKMLADWEASIKPNLPTKEVVPTSPWIQSLMDAQYGSGKIIGS